MGDGGGGQGCQLKHFCDKMMIVNIANISKAEILILKIIFGFKVGNTDGGLFLCI